MPYVLLQQVSNKFAKSNAGKTLDHPVALKYLKQFAGPQDFDKLSEKFKDGKAYFWGAKVERGHQIRKMAPRHTLVLFRRGKHVFRIGVIDELLVNEELADRLWGRDVDGETWAIIYAMGKARDVLIDTEAINMLIGRKSTDNWQGMTSVEGEPAERVINYVRHQFEMGIWGQYTDITY